jgi:hypothetical protein
MVAAIQTILDQFLDPVADCLTREVAERIAELPFDASTQAELDLLANKAAGGELSAEEASRYHEMVEAIDIVGILKAKARARLRPSVIE